MAFSASSLTVSLPPNFFDGLPAVDQARVIKLVEEHGYLVAARILGFEVSHYEYLEVAGRLAMEHLASIIPVDVLEYAQRMDRRLHPRLIQFIKENHTELQALLQETGYVDYNHDWCSANTIITMYSMPASYKGKNLELARHVWLRVALQLHAHAGLEAVKRCYLDLSHGYYTPASPTLFNAGRSQGKAQMSSCFLLTIGDSMKDIRRTIDQSIEITAGNGGLGIDISGVRHSEIGDFGMSSGTIPLLQVYNSILRWVDQGGRRKGAATFFMRPEHIDIEAFIQLPLKIGNRYERAHDINTCVWTSRLFWKRVIADEQWTLFCPGKVPHLFKLTGSAFEQAYVAAEKDNTLDSRYKKVIGARYLHKLMITSIKETGMPYLMNACAANEKSNQQHLGYITNSNLCQEIVEYCTTRRPASCNLLGFVMYKFARHPVKKSGDMFADLREAMNFDLLMEVCPRAVNNLDLMIDQNNYPLDKHRADGSLRKAGPIRQHNMESRPLGIGDSGFAEVLYILDLLWDDPYTFAVNKLYFACKYFNCMAATVQLAILRGACEAFAGSPLSKGEFQFDLWAKEFKELGPNPSRRKEDDEPVDPALWGQKPLHLLDKEGKIIDTVKPTWNDLRRVVMKYGARNILLLSGQPTASISQVHRATEQYEAPQNNMYSRIVLTSSYPVLNRFMVKDLEKIGCWNKKTTAYLEQNNGSLVGFDDFVSRFTLSFPEFTGNYERLRFLQKKYATMWELSQRNFLKLAADRGRYICQSQSTNIYIADGDETKIAALHLIAYYMGLKTIVYYNRQRGGEVAKFQADPEILEHVKTFNTLVTEKERVEEKSDRLLHGSLDSLVVPPTKGTFTCDDHSCCTWTVVPQ